MVRPAPAMVAISIFEQLYFLSLLGGSEGPAIITVLLKLTVVFWFCFAALRKILRTRAYLEHVHSVVSSRSICFKAQNDYIRDIVFSFWIHRKIYHYRID